MKNSVIMAIVLGCTLGLMSETRAQYVETETSSSDFVAFGTQKTNFDKFRGIIENESNNHFVTIGDFSNISPVSSDGLENRDSGKKTQELQPASQLIDSLVTGKSNNTNFYQKFDSDGIPMAHHQEYPRPSVKNFASSLFEAIEINPYPGDQ